MARRWCRRRPESKSPNWFRSRSGRNRWCCSGSLVRPQRARRDMMRIARRFNAGRRSTASNLPRRYGASPHMPRESLAEKKLRTAKIMESLAQAYPDAHCELNFINPLQLLVATILSAQSTDKQVNIVTADLFKKYPFCHGLRHRRYRRAPARHSAPGLFPQQSPKHQSLWRTTAPATSG